MKKKIASSVVYMIFLFIVFLAFCAFAVDATIVYTTRAKLQNATEASALVAASAFNRLPSAGVTTATITTAATNTFNIFKVADLQNATIASPIVDMGAKTVLVQTEDLAPTYFLSFLGVPYIKLQAKARAISEDMPITANYTGNGINWITASSAYLSDIISKGSNVGDYYDTAILKPFGNYASASVDDGNLGLAHFDYLAKGDGSALNLGPGGYITIKLPAPIIDKTGPDLSIEEIGTSLEGYMVFVGLDVEPSPAAGFDHTTNGPYTDHTAPGKGIKWKNISCSGVSSKTEPFVDKSGATVIPTGMATTANISGDKTKFYGSGYFDIGATCAGNLSMAKYLRIVDDNDESAFALTSGKYYKTMMYGESSSTTPGADIDYVTVLNHVRLIAAP